MSNPALKVAMVAACPFPSLRGSQALVRGLTDQLSAMGHEVHVVTYPIAQHVVPIGRVAIHRVAKIPGLWTIKPLGWQKAILDLLLVVRLWNVVRTQGIDLIHAHNIEGVLVGLAVRLISGVPVIYHAHNALADELPHYFSHGWARSASAGVGNLFDRFVARAADATIAPSERLAAYYAARGGLGRISVILPSVSNPSNRPSALVDGNSARVPTLMYAGNLDPYQNLPLLLGGLKQVRETEPDARLVIVAHRASHQKVIDLQERLERNPGVEVRMVHSLAAMFQELSAADVLVCPRTSWSGFPIKVLNYMSLGIPIVHARGSAHAVEDGRSAIFFDDHDPFSLANSVLRVLRNPSFGKLLGQESRRVVREKYGWRATSPQLTGLYAHVVRRRAVETDSQGAARGVIMRERWTTRRGDQRPPISRLRNSMTKVWSLVSCCAFLVSFLALPGCTPRQSAQDLAPLPPLAAPPRDAETYTASYRLLPGDVVRVRFLYHPELNTKVPVEPDGNVAIEDVGVLRAEGHTAEELARQIEKISSKHLRDPAVTVIVAERGPHKVYVGGEVREPGYVVFREGMTPLQAILDRGGFTDVARTDSVLKITYYDEAVGPQATRLDFSKTIRQGTPELNALAVSDVLYVPRTFVGDANTFVRLYIRNMLPIDGRFSVPIF